MPKQPVPQKRQRRERGSINPDDILDGAFDLAEQVGVDNLSMPLLGKHLGVGVTSIYWYFRKKDELLDAMTTRALRQCTFATPYVEAKDWRQTLSDHARTMREAFLSNPILCDLILIRAAFSTRTAQLGAQEVERAISGLVETGLSPQDAFDTYSTILLHIRGSAVLRRLYEKSRTSDADGPSGLKEALTIDAELTPLLAQISRQGHRIGAPDDANFEYGLTCILDRAEHLIEQTGKQSRRRSGRPSTSAPKAH